MIFSLAPVGGEGWGEGGDCIMRGKDFNPSFPSASLPAQLYFAGAQMRRSTGTFQYLSPAKTLPVP